jgi:DNA replicative helicase MCM subunit Mcm2 (Cdc46/Mcm family)
MVTQLVCQPVKPNVLRLPLLLLLSQVSDEDVAAIEELGRQGSLFERLAASIAPEIYGMLEVKKVRQTI